VNERIAEPTVIFVDQEGKVLGERPIQEALEAARAAGMDLVEVAPQAKPPVCRLMDYGKFKYQHQRQRSGGAKHRASKLKELRLRPSTNKHDVEVRVKQARDFLERGDRVLVNMLFRGREMAHMDLGKKVLADFAQQLQDVAKVEKEPTFENRRMGMILVHNKA